MRRWHNGDLSSLLIRQARIQGIAGILWKSKFCVRLCGARSLSLRAKINKRVWERQNKFYKRQ